jgi:hypothetical protein
MKRIILVSLIMVMALAGQGRTESYLRGEIVSAVQERINLSPGDRVLVALPPQSGVITGDILRIARKTAPDPSYPTGRCAVVKVGQPASVCEIIDSKEEIQLGDAAFITTINQQHDQTFFPLIINTLRTAVQPYSTWRNVTIGILDIFDDKNNVSALGDRLKAAISQAFAQKPRVKLASAAALNNMDFHPGDDRDAVARLKSHMAQAAIDVLVSGTHRMQDGAVRLEFFVVRATGEDQIVMQTFPSTPELERLAAQVTTPYAHREKRSPVTCEIAAKLIAYSPAKAERLALIRQEAAGNPFVENALRRNDFNIVSPVEVKVRVDQGTILDLTDRPQQTLSLEPGIHRLTVSFKRGYFLNEVMLLASAQEVTREIVLDINRKNRVTVEVRASAMPGTQPLDVRVYELAVKERQIIRPLQRVETDKVVDYFKE